MADGHGGYRQPAKPAAISGPGQHSQRTDGKQPLAQLSNAGYGEQAAFQAAQQAAPVPQAQGAPAGPQVPLVGLGEPTQMPGTPVTDGAAYGAGAGPSALNLPNLDQLDSQQFQALKPMLVRIAMRDDTPDSTKQAIRRLLSQ